ncbi:sensor histidine kinase [Nocardia pseudovaccinii]|uniref:sensor histidine kinase n=1 Tax=Nocardia pseudovaccinii TaxID=189540 RepID=UPI000B13EC44|nr:HAMP domain-containing sensor histidine kinase [Nocardia pseudovaccinii]
MKSPKGRVSLSLRARVALVSGVVAALVAVTLGIAYTALLDATGSRQFDETVSTMGVAIAPPLDTPPHVVIRTLPDPPPLPAPQLNPVPEPKPLPTRQPDPTIPVPRPGPAIPTPQSDPAIPGPQPGPAVTTPQPAPAITTPQLGLDIPLPYLDPSLPGRVIVGPGDVRTAVAGAPGLVVRLEPDRALVDSAIRRSQLIGVGIGIAGVLLAAVLGWFLAGYAARPLRRLATATHGIDTLEQLPPLSGRGAREAEELSDAITRMLTRLEAAHGATNRALASARDFAAVCAHELRTPLTAMRTDLEVLATKDLPAEQQRAVLADVLLAERQIENTLTDLEQLAVGELTESDAFEPFELCETLDRAVQDARRRHPEVSIALTECPATTVTGLPGGLMLIVTNAVANAVQHGHARTITIAAHHRDPSIATASFVDPSLAGANPADPGNPAPSVVGGPADPATAGVYPADPKAATPNGDVRQADPNAFRRNACNAATAVEIIIDDDGTGIPESIRPTAFDRFIKGPGSPGSGLGLALVRQQAELHSGTAELIPRPDGGTRLVVRIPKRTG